MAGAIEAGDVVALVRALGGKPASDANAVADMIDAAAKGQAVEIDTKGLPVDKALMQRVMEAAGRSGAAPDQGSRLKAMYPSMG